MPIHRHHRSIALYLALLALVGGCMSSVSAAENDNKKSPERRRRRLGAKAMQLLRQKPADEEQHYMYMAEKDEGAIDEADEEFWARMLQQVGGSIPNQPPVANDVAATTRNDATVSGNVLSNDSDPDGDDIAVFRANGQPVRRETTLTLGSGAILTINNRGDYTYDPNGQYDYLQNGATATDSFTYTIADTSGATDSATVTITITSSATNSPTPGPTPGPTKAPTPVPPTPGESSRLNKIYIFFSGDFFPIFFHDTDLNIYLYLAP